jgi:hypothetical protein
MLKIKGSLTRHIANRKGSDVYDAVSELEQIFIDLATEEGVIDLDEIVYTVLDIIDYAEQEGRDEAGMDEAAQ